MPDLGSSFSEAMPKLSAAIGDVQTSASNYSMASVGTLLQEGWGKATGALGSLNPFKKAAVAAPPVPKPAVTETQGTAASVNASTQSSDSADGSTGHKVKLVAPADNAVMQYESIVNFPRSPLDQTTVEFDVMPEVQEIHSVEYEVVAAPQMPTEFQKYKGTKAVQWQINGTFVCRTKGEAYRNFIFLNNLRSWSKPFFGEKQRLQFEGGVDGRGKLGAPPPVLKFSGWRELVGEVPVVITSLNWNFPKDCDWIPCGVFDSEGKEVPFPTIMTVNVSMVESLSPDQVNGFDLVAFRNGQMVNAWLPEGDQPRSYERSEPLNSNAGNQSIANGTAQGVAPSANNIGAPKISTADVKTGLMGSVAGAIGSAKSAVSSAVDAAQGAVAGAVSSVQTAVGSASSALTAYQTGATPEIVGGAEMPAESASTPAVLSAPETVTTAEAAPKPLYNAEIQSLTNQNQRLDAATDEAVASRDAASSAMAVELAKPTPDAAYIAQKEKAIAAYQAVIDKNRDEADANDAQIAQIRSTAPGNA